MDAIFYQINTLGDRFLPCEPIGANSDAILYDYMQLEPIRMPFSTHSPHWVIIFWHVNHFGFPFRGNRIAVFDWVIIFWHVNQFGSHFVGIELRYSMCFLCYASTLNLLDCSIFSDPFYFQVFCPKFYLPGFISRFYLPGFISRFYLPGFISRFDVLSFISPGLFLGFTSPVLFLSFISPVLFPGCVCRLSDALNPQLSKLV